MFIILVQVIKCQTDKRQAKFLKDNSLRFVRVGKGEFDVEQVRRSFDGSSFWQSIGLVFRVKATYVFVPDNKGNRPEKWFFGITRCDAVSGFLGQANIKFEVIN